MILALPAPRALLWWGGDGAPVLVQRHGLAGPPVRRRWAGAPARLFATGQLVAAALPWRLAAPIPAPVLVQHHRLAPRSLGLCRRAERPARLHRRHALVLLASTAPSPLTLLPG